MREHDTTLATAVRQRRRSLVLRSGMGCITALVFTPVIGWEVVALWACAYFAIQVIEAVYFAPITSGRREGFGSLRTAGGLLVLGINSVIFSSLSAALWLSGGEFGGVAAAILVSAASIYAVMNSPRSKAVLAATLAPHVLYMAMTPVFMAAAGAPRIFIVAVTLSLIVYVGYCISLWHMVEKAWLAESAARREAEARQREAEALMNSRSAMLAAVGHDLRTPIGAILTGAHELERTATDSSARAHAALITQAGIMMRALLDDLLDHAKLEAGGMRVEPSDLPLRALLARSLQLWQREARAKGLRFRIEGAASVPSHVRADGMRLQQVMNNILSNALKFTTDGFVCVRFSAWVNENGQHALTIEISDSGPGMDREQLARLFTPFDQTAEGVSRKFGGSGLGLSISRDLVRLMGGTLTVRSEKGLGAAFTIALNLDPVDAGSTPALANATLETREAIRTLLVAPPALVTPARIAPAPAPAPAPAAAEPAVAEAAEPRTVSAAPSQAPAEPEAQQAAQGEDAGRALSVLIVDDHEINRRAIQLILMPLGVNVATAADGMAALEAAGAEPFDLVFMDVRMPELDGRETTRRLRAHAGPNQFTPVIAVTADTSEDDVAACMDAGMNYFVSKPLTPAALLGAVNHVLSAAAEAGDAGEGASAAA
ncbi:MAG: response regulator [Brevundimonas sp.]|uniref:response regulator n=1 Tax=Brevundimonas sp. TaxID=1871086 RepID=UPI003918C4EF